MGRIEQPKVEQNTDQRPQRGPDPSEQCIPDGVNAKHRVKNRGLDISCPVGVESTAQCCERAGNRRNEQTQTAHINTLRRGQRFVLPCHPKRDPEPRALGSQH